jgi:hypothetical protein
MALSTSTDGSISGQTNTQSPQTSAGSGSPLPAAAKSVQPGTATSLLSGPGRGSDGIPLTSTALPVANLNTATQTATVQSPPKTTKTQHPNVVLLVIVVALVIVAAVIIGVTHRSAKNTTNY